MEGIFLKQAKIQDARFAMNLINEAKQYLKEQGFDQWQNGYPDMECIQNDILHDRGYFVTDGTHLLAYLCIDFDGEPAHATLNGTWKSDLPYAVIHRIAISNAYKGRGLASIIFHLVDELCKEKKFIVFMPIPTRPIQSCGMSSRKTDLNIVGLCGLTIVSNMPMKNSLKQLNHYTYRCIISMIHNWL